MNTKQVGELAEASVMTALLRRGYNVLVPWGDNQRYDLVIEAGKEFFRVQVKSGLYRQGAVKFRAYSKTGWPLSERVLTTYQGEVDYFGVFCEELNTVYLVPIDDKMLSEVSLRIDPPANNQIIGVRWAKEYEV